VVRPETDGAAARGGLVADAAADVNRSVTVRIDGREPPTLATIRELEAVCASSEAHSHAGLLPVYVTGAPRAGWTRDLDVAIVTKWERAVRRLERLAIATVALAAGDCGGTALDALLATDHRIAASDVRLCVPVDGEATWPGTALYRLAQQAGAARIRAATLFGVPIGAQEALGLGLIDELADDPEHALVVAGERVSAFAGRELAVRRQLIFNAATTSFEEALGSHLAACDRALRRAADRRPS
jgi:isomerase DpgB